MSRLEHQRWMLDRFLDGWRPGGRSDYYRTRRTLVPFDQLDAGPKSRRTMLWWRRRAR